MLINQDILDVSSVNKKIAGNGVWTHAQINLSFSILKIEVLSRYFSRSPSLVRFFRWGKIHFTSKIKSAFCSSDIINVAASWTDDLLCFSPLIGNSKRGKIQFIFHLIIKKRRDYFINKNMIVVDSWPREILCFSSWF